ncbi:hypothetical protein BJV74DRAFT_123450 [Russula compacta]|nr:hypothetical protein BJV74DRAFT_123450 [Russula compacta]
MGKGQWLGKIFLVKLRVWRNSSFATLLMTHKDAVSAIDLCPDPESTRHCDILENSVTPMSWTERVCNIPTSDLPSVFRRRREVPPFQRSTYHHEKHGPQSVPQHHQWQAAKRRDS